MKVVKVRKRNGRYALVAIETDDSFRLKRNEVSSPIRGFPLTVVLEKKIIEDEIGPFHDLPLVSMDQTKSVCILKEDICSFVTVINIEEWKSGKIQLLYGIHDIFFIAKKKQKSIGWQNVGVEDFPYDIKDDNIRLYVRKMVIVQELHKAMQARHKKPNSCCTGVIAIDRGDFDSLVAEMGCTLSKIESKESVYGVLASGAAEKISMKNDVLKCTITDVSQFEKCFGFAATFKHDVSVQVLQNLMSFATTNSLFIQTKESDENSFSDVEFNFDEIRGHCWLSFQARGGNASNYATHFNSRKDAWDTEYINMWAISADESRKENSYQKPYAIKRKNVFDINPEIVSKVFAQFTSEEAVSQGFSNVSLNYVFANISKVNVVNVEEAFKFIMFTYVTLSIDDIIRELGITIHANILNNRDACINEVAKTLQNVYDDINK
jgi:hypothetical protein